MSYQTRSEFLEEYIKLCEQYKCFIDTGYGKPLYVMEFQYPVDDAFNQSVEKLNEDVG